MIKCKQCEQEKPRDKFFKRHHNDICKNCTRKNLKNPNNAAALRMIERNNAPIAPSNIPIAPTKKRDHRSQQ